MLLDIPPRRILGRFIPEPLPPPGTFDGQTVLVTGGTAGLGLAAAIHFARLGANVIITFRSEGRAETAKKQIEKAAKIEGEGRVTSLRLEMSSYAACVAFVEQLKGHLTSPGQLDVAVLNAGSIGADFQQSPEGWEQTIQVNALSTILIAWLLLAWMKEGHKTREKPAHMVFVSSRDHLYPDIKHWVKWSEQGGILRHLSSKENYPPLWQTTEPNYANSKLVMMYGVEEICKRALGPDGEPQVIVNSVCPGIVNTDIGRAIAGRSWLMRYGVPVYLLILGKSTDCGARAYVKAAATSNEEHGKFSIIWLSDKAYRKKAIPNMTSDEGKKVQKLVWEEIRNDLVAKVPDLDI